jgi:hypothetical protein
MSETIRRFQHSVKLPAENVSAALSFRKELEAGVQRAAASLIAQDAALKCTTSTDETGGCVVRLANPGYEIVVTSRCGQNTAFRQGEKLSFVSYSVSAAGNLKAFDRAVAVGREMAVIFRIAGAILFAALLFWGFSAILNALGFVKIPLLFVALAVLAGGWVGERLGYLLGNKLEAQSLAKADDQGVLSQFDAVWFSLEHKLNSLLKDYEAV